jgi:hypothetical protein
MTIFTQVDAYGDRKRAVNRSLGWDSITVVYSNV